jgi:hypothetical protein
MVADAATQKRQHAGGEHRIAPQPRSADQDAEPLRAQGVGQLLRFSVEGAPGTMRCG